MTTKSNVYTKLLAFQKLGISVKKDGKNPHFKSAYATLNEVLDKVKKPLNDLGLVIIFSPETDGLRTILYDTESETQLDGFMKYVGIGNAQQLLSCNTYFRRGSLVSLLGLEDEDDDGTKASVPVPPKVITKPKLLIGTQVFKEAVAWLNKPDGNLEAIMKKYEVSEEVKVALLEQVTAL